MGGENTEVEPLGAFNHLLYESPSVDGRNVKNRRARRPSDVYNNVFGGRLSCREVSLGREGIVGAEDHLQADQGDDA